ncbi:predicted protein [Nematostella vectensis]|uniref:Phosphotriesterase-related protein n=1 Tax=Nematostella vectensis TaxID=45351 RepID=PTER_NEMVE|nr:phosphotriesterase-related protein [Nematostella vectensis]A7RFA1.1 RecName: Full=Phosphotriesterase-related protein; AltName: Full=Parathion hydrolase-related protein [Nematostella vectensis]EDO49918.1 predicted protein [Nematostella vectensis]|eukprot:XP_001641981.1 predicted protein [Nematostella vectensis]
MTSGMAQTVCGLLQPQKLGRTLTHEHMVMDYKSCYFKPSREQDLHLCSKKEITMQNLYWLRQNPYSNAFNLSLGDEPLEEIIAEVAEFKKEGGSTIVDNTTYGIMRNVEALKKISMATDVNIICGTGYYLDHTLPPEIKNAPIEELTQKMVNELTVGVEGTNIKCGVIGEVGCSWPLTPIEKKSLQASAAAQAETGAPLIIHPGRDESAPEEIIRILQEAGGDISRTVMSHTDRTIFNRSKLVELAATGCYVEWDLFGMETLFYQANLASDMPSDSQRIQDIKFLLDEGYEDKIVIAHDIHTRHRLKKYGGHGYAHIMVDIVPKMLMRGVTQEQIDKIQIANPRTWLTFK